MKEVRKLIMLFICIIACGIFIQCYRLGYIGIDAGRYFSSKSDVVKNDVYPQNISIDKADEKKMLIIYSKDEIFADQYSKRIDKNLNYMKINSQFIDVTELGNIDLTEYETVISIVSNIEKCYSDNITEIMEYIRNGGKMLWGFVPSNFSEAWNDIYKELGIEEIKGYEYIEGFKFIENVMPSSKGRLFIDEEVFGDLCLNVKLDDECRVYIESDGDIEGIPILWERKAGNGKIFFYNANSLGGDYYGGLFAGIISMMQEDFMYPIINAKVLYIDDFPAPQYNIGNNIIKDTYNKSEIEFYRDIWWPDMQRAANKYDYYYTGLFISTYNDIVDPDKFVFEDTKMMEYYGKSMLKMNSEVGLHGYNHQSLALEGFIPEEVGYVPWKSQEDMEKSLITLNNQAEELFTGCKFMSYVPPSNYLSPEGRSALREALPNLRVISGIYAAGSSDEDRASYVQDFEIAEDGIAEFPRISAGMLKFDNIAFQYLNGLALHGVFSHFIHPDDILDKERGMGKTWDELYEGYCSILEDVNTSYPPIRKLKSFDTANALEVFEKLEPIINYEEDSINGYCNNFSGQAFFYLRTEKQPKSKDESCSIEQLGDEDYYMVTVNNAQFNIELN